MGKWRGPLENLALINSMNALSKKNVLVTGGAGFIGGWLVKELMDLKAKVIVIDLKSSSPILDGLQKKPVLIKGDVRNFSLARKLIEDYKIDFIFHMAAQTIVGVANQTPLPTLKTNIEGTWTILEASRKSPRVRGIVVASSDKAYGDQPSLPYTENTPLGGLNPYDASKSSADLLSQMYFKTYGLPLCIVRSANVFGGGDLHFSRIVPDAIRSAFYNKNLVIRSDGRFLRDYIYIKDKVRGCLILADALLREKEVSGEAFNFGTNKPQEVLGVVNAILTLMKKSHLKPIVLNQARNEIKSQSLNSAKAKKILGWQPQYSFEDGLKETIQWYARYFKIEKF